MRGFEPSVSAAARGLVPSATLAIQEESNERLARGERVFRLGLGQSPFPVPQPVVEALKAHAHVKDYLPVRGLPALRQAVASFHRARHGVEGRGPEQVLVGPGSKELLFLLQLCLDAELLVPSPSWVSYAPQAKLAGRPVRWVPASSSSRWLIEPDALERACREGSGLRLLLLNSPSNPVGTALGREACEALARVCRRHGLLVLSDEIYGELRFDGKHASFARAYPEGTIVSSGLSKWCGAGGWRLGTFLFPAGLGWLLEAMAAAASETYSSTCAPVQHAAVRAFEVGTSLELYLARARAILRLMTRWAAGRLIDAGAAVWAPDAAYYLFVDLSPMRASLARRGVEDDVGLCGRLLGEVGVAALPGSAFGVDRGALTVRLALVELDGARALAAQDEPESERFLIEYAPGTHQAIELMCGWLAG